MKNKKISSTTPQVLQNDPSSEDLMQFLQDSGIIISVSDVRKQFEAMQLENFIKNRHTHEIWQNEKDGRWYTYIFDDNAHKHRKLVSRKEKVKLIEFLYQRYEGNEPKPDVLTIRALYPEWLEYKKLSAEKTYIRRIHSDWKRFYASDPIVDRPLKDLTKIDLDTWNLLLIRDNDMTKKGYYNVTVIIRGIFGYAFDSNLIGDNTYARVRKNYNKLFRKVRKPSDESQVYTDEEIRALENVIWQDFTQKGRKVYRLAPLAVLFQLCTGVRVGELCALRYEDLIGEDHLHIQRMLVSEDNSIRDRTKGLRGEREIYLPEKAQEIIRKIGEFRKGNGYSETGYIFSLTDEPFPERTINAALKRYCDRAGIPYRPSHKLRKTAVSSLVNNGMSPNAVKEYAGHTDEKTTLAYYTFDREVERVRNAQIDKALSYA